MHLEYPTVNVPSTSLAQSSGKWKEAEDIQPDDLAVWSGPQSRITLDTLRTWQTDGRRAWPKMRAKLSASHGKSTITLQREDIQPDVINAILTCLHNGYRYTAAGTQMAYPLAAELLAQELTGESIPHLQAALKKGVSYGSYLDGYNLSQTGFVWSQNGSAGDIKVEFSEPFSSKEWKNFANETSGVPLT